MVLFACLSQAGLSRGAEIADNQSSSGTPAKSRSFTDTLIADGRSFGEISLRMCLAPFHANGKELLEAAGLVGVVALSSTLDRQIRKDMHKLNYPWAETVSDVGHVYQSTYVTFAAATALYGYGWWRDNSAVRRLGIEVIEAFAISGAGTSLLKHLVGRDRPFLERGAYHFVGPNWNSNDHLSFVSGDVTVAFALTSVLSAEAKSVPVTILLYSLATATSFQRLHADRHWFSDTVGAAVWGTTVGLGVVHLNRRDARTRVGFSADPGNGTAGIVFRLK
jgi:membrane-associated phospholipid phosphatase